MPTIGFHRNLPSAESLIAAVPFCSSRAGGRDVSGQIGRRHRVTFRQLSLVHK